MEESNLQNLTKKERQDLAREEKRALQQSSETAKKFKNLVIGLAVIIGLLFFGYKAWTWYNTPTDVPSLLEVTERDWVKGKTDAKVTLLEYGDFECPACASYAPIIDDLMNNYPDDLKIVYRHYPLPQHKNAVPSARAAEAAGAQGKFWEMYDVLYANQENWSGEGNPKEIFVGYAKDMGLDEGKFNADFDGDVAGDSIKADEVSATALGVSATPTFYINGRKAGTIRSLDDFKKQIENALNAQ